EYGQDDQYADQVQPGPAHDAVRQPGPGAPVGALLTGPAVRQRDTQRVDPVPEHGQPGREQGQRGDHRDGYRGHPAVPHGPEEDLGEQQQAGQREGDGDAGDRDGTPGGTHGPYHGGTGVVSGPQFLPEPAHHEQRVVDGQAQPDQRDDVDREHRHVG